MAGAASGISQPTRQQITSDLGLPQGMIDQALQNLTRSTVQHVTDVEILRDGGTIVFTIETDDRQRLDFSLASPIHGDPRLLSVGVSKYSDKNLRTISQCSFQPGGKHESRILGLLRRWVAKQDSSSTERPVELIGSVVDYLSAREGTNDLADDLSETDPLKIRVVPAQGGNKRRENNS